MENFKLILKEEANKINIILSDAMLEKFENYKKLLVEWNEKMNLTAITDDYGIIMKHFIDSIEIVKYIRENENIIDVGTGAGFPGIVIAIYFEGKVNITLIDALEKRINFLKEVKEKLNLQNIQIVHGRAEELAIKEEYRQKYDVATARAVASLNTLLEFDSPFIGVGGRCLLLKSEKAVLEIEESKNALNILNLKMDNIYEYSYKVNDEIYSRCILDIKKMKDTPNKYPRNFGKIKKNPL